MDIPLSTPVSLPLPIPLSVWGSHPGIGVVNGASSPDNVLSSKSEQMSLQYRSRLCQLFYSIPIADMFNVAKPCKYFEFDGACPHGSDCNLSVCFSLVHAVVDNIAIVSTILRSLYLLPLSQT